MPIPILETKLSVPLLRQSRISRPTLTDRLNDSIVRTMTLLSAPAGYGKTTLICEWLSELENLPPDGTAFPAVAWVSMDGDDQDLDRFLAHLIISIARVLPDLPCFSDTDSSAPLSEAGLLGQPGELINCLALSDKKLIVVLDDYHSGETNALNDWLSGLVRQAPENLHIVVSTRQDPGIPMARLRANGSLAEIRAVDLRLSPKEIGEIMTEVFNLNLDNEQATALENRLEGWAAGINLAGLTLDGRGNLSRQIESISGQQRYIAEYLMEEVLARQSDDIRDFLVATSPLKRFNASLCDAVMDSTSGRDLLNRLYRNNSFLISLDREDSWYRYHHLFSDLLQQRFSGLNRERQNAIHAAAGRWFEENGYLSEAIDHTLIGGDMENFSRLILSYVDRVFLGVGDFRSVERWMTTIPEDRKLDHPRIAVVWAWTLFYSMRISDVVPVLGRIEEMAADDDSILAESDVIRASLAAATGDMKNAAVLYERAYRRSESTNDAVRGISALGIGYSGMIGGNSLSAVGYLQESVDYSLKAGNVSVALKAGTYLGLVHIELGKLQQAEIGLQKILNSATVWHNPQASILCMTYAAMADLAREQHRSEDAERLLEQACINSFDVSTLQAWYVQVVRSLTLFSRGDVPGAMALINTLRENSNGPMQIPAIRSTTEAYRIRYMIVDDLSSVPTHLVSEVESWITRLPETFDQNVMAGLSALPGHGCEFVPLMKARVLIWLQRYESALSLLQSLLDLSIAAGRNRSAIENLILQAVARDSLGEESDAVACISEALTFAPGQKFTRVYTDEGPAAARLLYMAGTLESSDSTEIQRLLSAFPEIDQSEIRQPELQSANTGLLEPLSERELDVLRLMAVGNSNQEIGNQLFISPQTVKAHSRNIYGKLDTHSRTAAVNKARLLGLLPGT